MNSFQNAKYEASKLLEAYKRELSRLNERWPEIELWHDHFQKDREKQIDAQAVSRDNDKKEQSIYLEAVDARFRDEYFNMTKKWWQKTRPVKELPPRPKLSVLPLGLGRYSIPAQTRLFLRLKELRLELQAGYQAAYLGSTIDATAEQMAEIFSIAQGTKLNELLQKFDEFNRDRPNAGNTQE